MAWDSVHASFVTTADYGRTPGTGLNREDLIEAYLNIDPTDRPLMQSIGKTKATHPVYHEWSDDTLVQPKASITMEDASTISLQEGAAEGGAFRAMTGTVAQRRNNFVQTFRADWVITGDQIAANPAGIGDMFALEDQKWMDALLNAVEARCLSTSSSNGVFTGETRLMKTLDDESADGLILGTPAVAAGVVSNIVEAAPRAGADGVAAALTEALVLDMLQGQHANGGKPTDIHVSPGIHRRISRTFVGVGSAGVEAPLGRSTPVGVVQAAFEGYETSFGGVRLVNNRWVTTATEVVKGANVNPDPTGADPHGVGTSGRVWSLQRNLIKWAWYRPFQSKVQGLDGDRLKGVTLGSGTLQVRSQKAHGAVKRISDATV